MQPGMGSQDRSVFIWTEENMCVLMLISDYDNGSVTQCDIIVVRDQT